MTNSSLKRIFILFYSLLIIAALFPVEAFASTRISVLTSMPCDQEIYTLWGHSAIRVKTEERDCVYNYGVFSFGEGFVYKFVKGETDYWLQREHMNSVFSEVSLEKNTYFYEQVLNVSEEEASAIYEALKLNALRENRYYRYNFFYDNCATRPRDLIEKILGDLDYPKLNNTDTYRDKVHALTEKEPWLLFGIDLCLGSETDRIISDYDVMFLPHELMLAYDKTNRMKDGQKVPLIQETNVLYKPYPKEENPTPFWLTPIFVFAFLAILIALFTLWQYKTRNKNVLIDCILFGVYGLIGLLLFFLTFFSTHPCVNPNFNLFWCNPVQLLFPLFYFIKPLKRVLTIYLWANIFTCLIPIIGYSFIPQEFHIAVIPLAIIMIVRSLYLLIIRGEIKKIQF